MFTETKTPSLLRVLVSDNADAVAPPSEEQLNYAGLYYSIVIRISAEQLTVNDIMNDKGPPLFLIS